MAIQLIPVGQYTVKPDWVCKDIDQTVDTAYFFVEENVIIGEANLFFYPNECIEIDMIESRFPHKGNGHRMIKL